jgi:hypothetical protein
MLLEQKFQHRNDSARQKIKRRSARFPCQPCRNRAAPLKYKDLPALKRLATENISTNAALIFEGQGCSGGSGEFQSRNAPVEGDGQRCPRKILAGGAQGSISVENWDGTEFGPDGPGAAEAKTVQDGRVWLGN